MFVKDEKNGHNKLQLPHYHELLEMTIFDDGQLHGHYLFPNRMTWNSSEQSNS